MVVSSHAADLPQGWRFLSGGQDMGPGIEQQRGRRLKADATVLPPKSMAEHGCLRIHGSASRQTHSDSSASHAHRDGLHNHTW